jgi:hypothetical protein
VWWSAASNVGLWLHGVKLWPLWRVVPGRIGLPSRAAQARLIERKMPNYQIFMLDIQPRTPPETGRARRQRLDPYIFFIAGQ